MRWFLTKKLVEKVHFNAEAIGRFTESNKISDFYIDKIKRLRTTFQFDENYTFKILEPGSNSKEYYKHVSCEEVVDSIQTPILFLHSRNDPICR